MDVHVVSHTHWDREWYHVAGRFRQWLVTLMDELLEHPPTEGASFLLDGQAVLLEDYLTVRPECAADLAALLRSGALEAGPWFVLADELIPGGEALVRNLLAGRRVLQRLRAESPPVLYCPDSFGHPAALPELARGFGFETIVLWRGFGGARWPAGDACRWEAPSGAHALLYHLPHSGYEFGANLPTDGTMANVRWREIEDELGSRSRLGVVLLPNGADHHARQSSVNEAIQALRAAATPSVVLASSLSAFVRAAEARAAVMALPLVRGELRDSYGYAWTLQGTLGTRAAQKRRAALAERTLVRDVEPWVALAGATNASAPRALTHAVWHELLLCHPHDTLCGCSIDAVARAFDARLDEVEAQSAGLRGDALHDVIGHDRERARTARAQWQSHVILRNPVPRARGGVAIVEVMTFVADAGVGHGSIHVDAPTRPKGAPRIGGLGSVQMLERALVHERTESSGHYPDNDLVERALVAVWTPELDGYAVRTHAVDGRRRTHEVSNPVKAEGFSLSNGHMTVRVHDEGRVAMHDHTLGHTIDELFSIDDRDDLGDLYTPSLRGATRSGRFLGARAVHRGPLRGTIETRWRVTVRKREQVDLRIRVTLDANASFVRLSVVGENQARDHRLRLRIATGVPHSRIVADAAFGPVLREPLDVPEEDARAESVVAAAPLHRYLSFFGAMQGATLFSDGLAEYEAPGDGTAYVTLVRSVGELSRSDLPERPGYGGWPVSTPEAQCIGPFAAELAVLVHGPRDDTTIDRIERTADDVLLPLRGTTLRSAIAVASDAGGITLHGAGLAFGCAKSSDDGRWIVLRCVNLLDREAAGSWSLSGEVREVRWSRLDETLGEALPMASNSIAFRAAPRAVVTILVAR